MELASARKKRGDALAREGGGRATGGRACEITRAGNGRGNYRKRKGHRRATEGRAAAGDAPSKRQGPQRRFLPVADANAYLRAKQLAGAAARDMRSPSAAAWPLLKQLKQRPPQLRFA